MANELRFDKLYPWIKQVDSDKKGDEFNLIANDGQEATVRLPWHLWMADLGVFYVIDDSEAFAMVQSGMVPDGMTEDALFEKATENLLRDVEFQMVPTNWGGSGIVCGGNFEACAICIPGIAAFIGQQYGEDYVLAVPARDVVIMAPASDEDRIHNLKVTVRNVFESEDHPLSKHLFRYSIETHEFTDIGKAY